MPFKPAEAPNLGNAPTASDVILKYIRDSIADGSLDEGEPIRQDDVARIFNVSKIPVREALKRLEAEGFVEFQRNKGAIVKSVSEPEIAQIFEVRAILETAAIRLSVPHMNERTFMEAQAYCDGFWNETDASQWSQWNWKFHSRLYEDAGRPFMINTIRAINERLDRYLRVQLTLSNGREIAHKEHRELLDACRKGDAEDAARLIYKHIMDACQALLRNLPNKDR